MRNWGASVVMLVLCNCTTEPAPLPVNPLPVGAGVFFSEHPLFGNWSFRQVDPLTGTTIDVAAEHCPWLRAMDVQPNGIVLAVAGEEATAYEVDPLSGGCNAVGALPEIMQAVAVRADGHVFTIGASFMLYELDADLNVITSKPTDSAEIGGNGSTLDGMDFAPGGTLYTTINANGWGSIDIDTGVVSLIGVADLRDDIDIDSTGVVREMSSGEYRTYNLAGDEVTGVSLYGSSLEATAVVYR